MSLVTANRTTNSALNVPANYISAQGSPTAGSKMVLFGSGITCNLILAFDTTRYLVHGSGTALERLNPGLEAARFSWFALRHLFETIAKLRASAKLHGQESSFISLIE